MCMVSNIGDGFKDQFPWKYPKFPNPLPEKIHLPPEVTKEEFESLKKEMQELKKLLKAAQAYDKATGQPDCEMDEKVKLIKAIAKIVGVDLGDVFGKEKPKK